jgi:riboflavin-specific deaminase-like protein
VARWLESSGSVRREAMKMASLRAASQARPLVTLHFAQTLDGRIALRCARVELSTPEGIEHAHRARAEHDAVLVGVRTVVVDDPLLTVRACDGPQPLRVVLASALAVPEGARLIQSSESGEPRGRVVVLGAEGRAPEPAQARLRERGAEVVVMPATEGGWVSLPHALAELHARGVRRLLVEGGASVLTSFLRGRLADRAEIEIAPRLLGETAIAAVGALGEAPLASAVALRQPVAVERLGGNLLLRGEIDYPA